MSDEISKSAVSLSPRRALALLAIAFGISAALVGLFFKGSWGLGFTLSVFVAEAGLWLYADKGSFSSSVAGIPVHVDRGRHLLMIAMTAVILILGCTYVLFDNMILHALNFPVVFYLYIVQSLLQNGSSDRDWDEPLFWLESALAAVVRPFICLTRLGWMGSRAFGRKKAVALVVSSDTAMDNPHPQGNVPVEKAVFPGRLIGQILLGILFAIPVLLIAGSLLASADAVFSQGFSEFIQYWKSLSIKDRLADLALTWVLFPFIFSYLESCRSKYQLVSRLPDTSRGPAGQKAFSHRERQLKLNPIMLISFLVSINLLYVIFAVIQLAYLTGAFQASLPAGMSYAEYARNGFFELAAISFINVGLIVLAVKGAARKGLTGKLLRSQSLLLVAGSLVQWLSAMFRMNMYVQVFGQTLLRFFVSAFMILIAVIFVLLVFKEFKPSFPVFKSAAIAAVVALVLLNLVNPDAWIARHNTQRSIANPSLTFDKAYFRELSPDALIVLLDALPQMDKRMQPSIAATLIDRYTILDQETSGSGWQHYNWCKSRALAQLEIALPGLHDMK